MILVFFFPLNINVTTPSLKLYRNLELWRLHNSRVLVALSVISVLWGLFGWSDGHQKKINYESFSLL